MRSSAALRSFVATRVTLTTESWGSPLTPAGIAKLPGRAASWGGGGHDRDSHSHPCQPPPHSDVVLGLYQPKRHQSRRRPGSRRALVGSAEAMTPMVAEKPLPVGDALQQIGAPEADVRAVAQRLHGLRGQQTVELYTSAPRRPDRVPQPAVAASHVGFIGGWHSFQLRVAPLSRPAAGSNYVSIWRLRLRFQMGRRRGRSRPAVVRSAAARFSSSGYFFGRGIAVEFLARGPKSSFQILRQTRPASDVTVDEPPHAATKHAAPRQADQTVSVRPPVITRRAHESPQRPGRS